MNTYYLTTISLATLLLLNLVIIALNLYGLTKSMRYLNFSTAPEDLFRFGREHPLPYRETLEKLKELAKNKEVEFVTIIFSVFGNTLYRRQEVNYFIDGTSKNGQSIAELGLLFSHRNELITTKKIDFTCRDKLLMPDLETAAIDPFREASTLSFFSHIVLTDEKRSPFNQEGRFLGKQAE